MSRGPSLLYLQSYLPHGLSLLLIVILILAAQEFIGEHPALAASLVFTFSLPYFAAAVRARRAYYLYGGMLLGAASYFMAGHALGAAPSFFPLLSLPLVSVLWVAQWRLRKVLPAQYEDFPATMLRATNITVAAFAAQALWLAPSLITPAGVPAGVAAATLLGYATLYLIQAMVFRSQLYAYVFSAFLTVGLAVAGLALMPAGFLPFFLEAGAPAILVAANCAYRIGGFRLCRNYYVSLIGVLGLAVMAIWLEPGYGLYVCAIGSVLSVLGYLLLARAVPDARLATSIERLTAKLLVAAAVAFGLPIMPFLFMPSLAPYWAAPALATGVAFGALAWRRRFDTFAARNAHVYVSTLFLTAAVGGALSILFAGPTGAGAVALLIPLFILHRTAGRGHAASARAFAESMAIPAFFGWFFPLMGGDAAVAVGASVTTLAVLQVGAAARRQPVLLFGAGAAIAGAWLACTPAIALAAATPLWFVLAAGAAVIVGALAAVPTGRQDARRAVALAWVAVSALSPVLVYAAGDTAGAALASACVAATGLVAAGVLGRGASTGWLFSSAAWLIAILGAGVLGFAGAAGNLELLTVALAFALMAAAGLAAWLIGRNLWLGRTCLAAFGVAAILLAKWAAPGAPEFALYAAVAPLLLFAAAAAVRPIDAPVAASSIAIGHATAVVIAAIVLISSRALPLTLPWAAMLAPLLGIYVAGSIIRRLRGFYLGAAALLSLVVVFGAAGHLGLRYAECSIIAALLGVAWLGLGLYAGTREKRGQTRVQTAEHESVPVFREDDAGALSTSLFLAAAFVAGAAALMVSIEPPNGEAWGVFLVAGVVFAALSVIQRQDIYAYLVTVCLSLMLYEWIRTSTSHFTQDVMFYPVVAAVLLGMFLLLPQFKHLANRLAALPVFGIFSLKGAAFAMLPLMGGAAFLMSAYSLKVTAHPRFCTSCHYMDQYYDSWQHSSHKGVACIECHYEPGLKNEIAGKGEGLIQLIKYVSHSYTNRPHGIVSNESCLRSGCHSDIVKSGETLLFNGKIRFRHDRHLNEHPRGQDLNCVSCHGQMVQGTHIGVTPTTCLTCHFYGRGDKPVAAGDCLSCHAVLDETVKIGNENFNHPAFLADKSNVGCNHCHSQVTQGDGAISPVRCRSCHLESYGPVEDPEAFHLIHVQNKHFDCLQCHDEIRHGTRPMDRQVQLSSMDCSSCHGGERHTIQERIYAGTAVPELEASPDFMYVAGVTCDGCHTDAHLLRVGEMTLTGRQSGTKQCAECHADDNYGTMLKDWQEEIHGRVDELTKRHDAAAAALAESAARETQAARETLGKAKTKLDHVVLDGSYGAHNYFYITGILDSAAADLDAGEAAVATLLSAEQQEAAK